MNAKWMPVFSVAAAVCLTSACLVSTVRAEVGQLSRSDVDKLLADARSAIQAGNLDRAAALVEQAETAAPRYTLFHLGPTPALVRRELERARRENQNNPQSNQSTVATGMPEQGYQRAPSQHLVDPFAQRMAKLPAGPLGEPIPPTTRDEMSPPVTPALHNQQIGERGNAVSPASAGVSSGERYDLLPAMLPPLQNGPVATQPALAALRPATGGDASVDQKGQALKLLSEARQAMAAGDLEQAEEATRMATSLGVPESAFLPHEDRPSLLVWDLQRARSNQPSGQSGSSAASTNEDRYAAQAGLPAEGDLTRTISASTQSELRFAQMPEPLDLPPEGYEATQGQLPAPAPLPLQSATVPITADTGKKAPSPWPAQPQSEPQVMPAENEAVQLFKAGEVALERNDPKSAAALFGQAYVLRESLDPAQQIRLQSYLQKLAAVNPPAELPTPPQTSGRTSASTLLDAAAKDQQARAHQMSAEVGKKQSEARRMRETKPKEAITLLQETRRQVADSQLSEEYRTQLLRRIDITLDETEKYIKDHHAEIELDQQNKAVLDEIERHREVRVKVQEKVAELVDEFNRLRDEQRYAEMEIVARRLIEIAPEEEVAKQVWQNAKFIRRTMMNQQVDEAREQANWQMLHDVETSSYANVDDANPLIYDQKRWEALVKGRKGSDRETRRTERELEIERRLKTPVLLRYEDAPLSEVVQGLSELAGVNIHLDQRGLSQEGVESSTSITINLSKEITLKSALNLILEPLHLSYVIKDEVLKITSEALSNGEVETKVYNVADLVIPIPNFVPNNNIGLQGLINDAHATIGYGAGGIGTPGPTVLVNDAGPNGTKRSNKNVLAQQFGGGMAGGGIGGGGTAVPIGSGPGGMGGGANADFDTLIDLIVSTVAQETWAENGGGEAEIRPFFTNLSLVISQTQAVHEEIADLLQQLRRLQDLQVTIEVRFIRLNDSFFERIGMDFDLNIGPPASATTVNPDGTVNQNAPSAIVGARPAVVGDLPVFTSDLEVPFRQESFSIATAPFGSPQQVANFGFAILSEIEAYFLIEAAQGDRRTNVLNAPKVTLFNGQQAFVADAISRPFVVGVIPVVGEFAAAQQPVIVVLNEGTLMTIQAVVSNDRRYVRLTVVPFFTQVGDVQEFTFEGTSSTTTSSSTVDNDEDQQESESQAQSRSGVTVQLPSFSFVSVVTTVSVPDGGTVLLGGIKRLSEGRNEIGVPLLSKVPYVNRLFRNVGIGRETESLMMMVTPRIIIQEEEEERLGITSADQGTY